jgi:hypothetical protein
MATSTTVTTADGRSVPARLDAWLLDHDQELHTRLAGALAGAGAGAGAGGHVPAFVTRLALREVRRVLPDPLLDLLMNGVKGHVALRDAARATIADGSTRADVVLYRRTLHTTHTVDVQVVAGVLRTSLEIVVAADFDVVDARADVSRGRLCALSLRDPAIAGRVSARVDGVETDELCRRDGTLRLGGRLTFDPALQILSDADERSVTRLAPT